jgi:sn-glycerol 3-phosphate transport system permease protein
VAGITAFFLFNRHIGFLFDLLVKTGWDFRPETVSFDSAAMLVLVSVWKQVPVNFVFFLAGLQGIPKSVREAAQLDCHNGMRRFWTITFPLLAPTAFFLVVINITYAFFDTFGIIDTLTQGRPGGATTTMVYNLSGWLLRSRPWFKFCAIRRFINYGHGIGHGSVPLYRPQSALLGEHHAKSHIF